MKRQWLILLIITAIVILCEYPENGHAPEGQVIDKWKVVSEKVKVSLELTRSPSGEAFLHAVLRNEADFPVYIMKGDVEFAIVDDQKEVRLYYGYHPEKHARPGVQINLVIPRLQPVHSGDKYEWDIAYPRVIEKLVQNYSFVFLVRVAVETVSGQGSRTSNEQFNEYLKVSAIVTSNTLVPR